MAFLIYGPLSCSTPAAADWGCRQAPPTNQPRLFCDWVQLILCQKCPSWLGTKKCLWEGRNKWKRYTPTEGSVPSKILFERTLRRTVGPLQFLSFCTASGWVTSWRLASFTYKSSSPRCKSIRQKSNNISESAFVPTTYLLFGPCFSISETTIGIPCSLPPFMLKPRLPFFFSTRIIFVLSSIR